MQLSTGHFVTASLRTIVVFKMTTMHQIPRFFAEE
jgi:hypothetical protein